MKIDYSVYPTLLDSFYWAKRLGKWQELIDKINRVKTAEWPEAVQKGMCFEQTVSNAILGVYNRVADDQYINTKYSFNKNLVDKMAAKLKNNIGLQTYIQGNVLTPLGNVKMYGFVDFVYPEFYIDLKTCGAYKKGKYEINTQHKCYPLIGGKKSLTYYITDFNDVYTESYSFNNQLKEQLIFELTEFIEWLNINKELITDTKIFGK
jgi:hypothetical protein